MARRKPPEGPFRRARPSAPSLFARATSSGPLKSSLGHFARSTPRMPSGPRRPTSDPSGLSRKEIRDLRRWGASIPGPDTDMTSIEENRAANIMAELDRMRRKRGKGSLRISKKELAKLEKIQWDKWYYLRLTVEDYDTAGDETDEAPPDYSTRRQLPFYGQGSYLLHRLLGMLEVLTVHRIDVHEAYSPEEARERGWAKQPDKDAPPMRPLFSGDTIHLKSGRIMSGVGRVFQKKPGPKRKRKGTKVADIRRALEAERKARSRAKATQAKIAKLSGSKRGAKKAQALQKRSDAARKGHERAQHKRGDK